MDALRNHEATHQNQRKRVVDEKDGARKASEGSLIGQKEGKRRESQGTQGEHLRYSQKLMKAHVGPCEPVGLKEVEGDDFEPNKQRETYEKLP